MDAVPTANAEPVSELVVGDGVASKLLEYCREGLIILGAEGNVRFVSRSFADLLGYPSEGPVPNPLSLVLPADLPRAMEALRQVVEKGPPESPPRLRVRHITGAELVVEVAAHNLLDDPEINGILLSVRDVTADVRLNHELAASEARHRALVQHGYDVAAIVEPDGSISYVSPTMCERFGHPADSLLGSSGWDFIHPDDVPLVDEVFRRALKSPGVHGPVEYRLLDGGGRWRWAEELIKNALDDPAIRGLVINIRDVSERIEAQELLRREERRQRLILDTVQEGIWLVDLDQVVLYLNEHAARQVGRPVADLVGLRLEEIFGREQILGAGVSERMRARHNGQVDQYELSVRTPEGEDRCLLVTGSGLSDEEGVFLGSLTSTVDISERKRLENELWRQSLFDSLTGLPNRALYEDRLGQAALQSEPGRLSLLCIDLDNLRVVNANAGHESGDEVLRVVAARLQAVAGPLDTVARIDGDQFVLLCPTTDAAPARAVALAVLESISAPITVGDRTLFITATIGLANSDDTDPLRLLPTAHSAMFRGKTRGRGRVETTKRSTSPSRPTSCS